MASPFPLPRSRLVPPLGSLHHSAVLLNHAGEAAGVHYLAMELLSGLDLARCVARHGPLPVTEAVEYVRQACVGMQHAHECGIVHRDLKPHNLFLTQRRQVKILDLGLALMAAADTLTHAGGCFGTVDYLAPEQVMNSHKVDVRADIYSLGCTLYHLLAGRAPFADAHPAGRAALHLSQEPPALQDLRPDVPPAVVEVVRKMMEKDRERRYRTPGEAAEALA